MHNNFPGPLSCTFPQALPSTDNSRHPHMVPPVASKSTTDMLSRSTLAVTTLSWSRILKAELCGQRQVCSCWLSRKGPTTPRPSRRTTPTLDQGTMIGLDSGVNNTRRTCRNTLSCSHDYVTGPPALPILNIANLFNS